MDTPVPTPHFGNSFVFWSTLQVKKIKDKEEMVRTLKDRKRT